MLKETDKEEIVDSLTGQINDLFMRSHNSKNKEYSTLFAEIRRDFKVLREDFQRVERAINKLEESYTEKILPNLNTWNNTSTTLSRLAWLVVSIVVTALLGLVIMKNGG